MRARACPRCGGDAAAPPSLEVTGTLLPQLSLQADLGGQSQTHQLQRTPNIPSAPHGSNGAVSFQEALESADWSTRTEGSEVSWGAAFSPAGFTPLFGKLRLGAHPDPPWPLFLLSPAPGKPQSGQPCSLPPQRKRRGLTGLSLHSASQTSQGHQRPVSIRPPLSVRVIRAFCDLSHTTRTCSRGRAHTYTHAYMGTHMRVRTRTQKCAELTVCL